VTVTMQSGLAAVFDAPLSGATTVLSLADVMVTFGGIVALSGVGFTVDRHEVVAIVGPNGAGKSTLLNAVSRLVRSTGTIELLGSSIQGVPPARIARAGVGRSFQDPQLIDEYTVLENVLCGAHGRLRYGLVDQVLRHRKVDRAEREMTARAEAILNFVGLDRHAGDQAGSLSYGARKLVDIVRAMVSGPRLLLLDEPSSGLDAGERASLQATLLALREERLVTTLVVEHHMDLVRSVATRVVGMQAGEVIAVGTPSDVLDSEAFREAVIGGSHRGGK
jgi:branched-chain amino acid transport system ATP-binding protein